MAVADNPSFEINLKAQFYVRFALWPAVSKYKLFGNCKCTKKYPPNDLEHSMVKITSCTFQKAIFLLFHSQIIYIL